MAKKAGQRVFYVPHFSMVQKTGFKFIGVFFIYVIRREVQKLALAAKLSQKPN